MSIEEFANKILAEFRFQRLHGWHHVVSYTPFNSSELATAYLSFQFSRQV